MPFDLGSFALPSSESARSQVFLRSAAAAFTAFVVGLVVGPLVLRWLDRLKIRMAEDRGDSLRLDQMMKDRRNTPIMGGLIIVAALLISIALCGDLANAYVILAMLGAIGFCLIGMIDDCLKTAGRKGMNSGFKFVLQSLVATALATGLLWVVKGRSELPQDQALLHLNLPFTAFALDLSAAYGIPYVLVATLVMVGTSNSVNLADGLDGLAPGCMIIASAAFACIAFAVGRPDVSQQWSLLHVRGAQEMTVVAAALAGATLAFLWFNSHPAEVFMGDTGSLCLGGLLGYIALVTKQEILLIIVGGVFVVEALSVILQVASFRLRGGARVFRCAPLHHHFQFGGMHEVKIVTRFWIVGLLCAILGLVVLKFG